MDEAQEDIQDGSQPLFSDSTQDDLEIFEVVPDLGQEAGADVQMDVSEVLQADLGDGPRASSPAPDAIYVEEAVVPGQENDPVQVPVQAPVQAPVCEVPPNRRTPIPDLSPIPSFQPAQRPQPPNHLVRKALNCNLQFPSRTHRTRTTHPGTPSRPL